VERLVVQLDEPALAAVLGGKVPTASGFGRHRSVDRPEASDALGWVFAAITEEGAEPWVHSCAAGTPLDLVRGAGARGLSVDLSQQGAADHDVLAEALDAGETVVLGVVPSTDADLGEAVVVERVLRWLDLVGLDVETVGDRLAISGTCGLAGASHQWARRAIEISRRVAAELTG
jgi:methionine synthase II (cobalamin-independent)